MEILVATIEMSCCKSCVYLKPISVCLNFFSPRLRNLWIFQKTVNIKQESGLEIWVYGDRHWAWKILVARFLGLPKEKDRAMLSQLLLHRWEFQLWMTLCSHPFPPSTHLLFPPQLCKSYFWTGSRKLHILQAKSHKHAMYTRDIGSVS